jgi:hypothetical protein
MTSRSKNVNLNKEPFEGYVRHWKRQWVFQGDRSKEDKGAWTLRLIKWVPTGLPGPWQQLKLLTTLDMLGRVLSLGRLEAAACTQYIFRHCSSS